MNCDRIARHYHWMERLVFGDGLQRRRTAFLSRTKDRRRALVLGEGDGRFLEAFLRANKSALVDCVDLSAEMIGCARRRLQHDRALLDRTTFRTCDVFDVELKPRHYDMVVTHFFLDCFEVDQLHRLIPRVAAACAADAVWLVADFRLPAKRWPRRRASVWIGIMYLLFWQLTALRTRRLVDPATFLRANGFELADRRSSQAGFLVSEVWQAVAGNRPDCDAG